MARATSSVVVRRPLGLRDRAVLELLVFRGSSGRGRGRHAGADGVGGDAPRGELGGELADIGLERGLGRGDRAVVGQARGAPRRRHRIDPAALSHEPAPDHFLGPVDEAVGHHVERHVHLRLDHRFLHGVGDEELEGAEGEGVEQDPELAHLVARRQDALHLARHLRAPLFVGGVDVEEAGLAAGGLDVGEHALGLGLGGLPVEVHAEDIAARPGEGQARRRAEAGRCPQDERPAAELDGFGVDGHDSPPCGIRERPILAPSPGRVVHSVLRWPNAHGQERRHRAHRQRDPLRQGHRRQRRLPVPRASPARRGRPAHHRHPRRGGAHRGHRRRVQPVVRPGLHLGRRRPHPRRRHHGGHRPSLRRPA